MSLTGNIFVDSGNIVMSKINGENGNTSDTIEQVLNIYKDWDKAIHSFFPSSIMTKSFDLDRLKEIYINGNYEFSFRDKIMLNGSGSFVNFFPSMYPIKEDIDVIRAHFLSPLASFQTNNGPSYILVQPNLNTPINFIYELIELNLKSKAPHRFDLPLSEIIMLLFKEIGTSSTLTLYLFSNYGLNPHSRIIHYKNYADYVIRKLRKNKSLKGIKRNNMLKYYATNDPKLF